MSDWPNTVFDGHITTPYFSGASSPDAHSITCASGSKGSWTEHIASTAHHARGIIVHNQENQALAVGVFVDVGVGGAGSEVVIAPDLFFWTGVNQNSGSRNYFLPVSIPAGSRISLRGQTGYGSTRTTLIAVSLIAGGYGDNGYNNIETAGTIVASENLTSVDPGGTANTKGSWAQLKSATTFNSKAALLAVTQESEPSVGDMRWRLDIGIGGAGSEEVIAEDINVSCSQTTLPVTNFFGPLLPIGIPSGTRVAARCSCSSNQASQRVLRVALYLLS